MSFYPSYEYQGTEGTLHRMSNPKLASEKDIISGHNYWDTYNVYWLKHIATSLCKIKSFLKSG